MLEKTFENYRYSNKTSQCCVLVSAADSRPTAAVPPSLPRPAPAALLFTRQYFRWGWLRLLRQLGNKQAAEAINRELDAMSEIGRDQNNQQGTPTTAPMPSLSLAHEGKQHQEQRHQRRQEALPQPPPSAPAGSDQAGSGGGGDSGGALGLSRRVAEAVDIKGLLEQNTDEVDNLMRALEGSYVKPGVGGEEAEGGVVLGSPKRRG